MATFSKKSKSKAAKTQRLGLYLSPSFGDRATQIEVHLSTRPFLLGAINTSGKIK